MNLTLIRSMTRSAVFELENELCYRPAHPFTVALNGKTVYAACNTNVFSLFSLLPGTTYTVEVQAEGETLKLDFTTEAETFFVDASRYGLVADGETDNTVRLQAALSTCPKGGTVYVPAGRYRTASLFMKSNTTLYLEKGAVLLGDNDRTHYPILPGVLPSENEVDEYYLTGWEGNPLDSFAGFLNLAASEETFANSISIPPQRDAFDSIREEYTTMLQNQLARGNNGLIKTKYLTFGIDADSIKAAKPRPSRDFDRPDRFEYTHTIRNSPG